MNAVVNNATYALVAAVAAILVYLAWIGLRRPVLAKIGLRNIPRRPTQSILIVVGLTLSTIIIVSALSIGDTLNYSVRRQAVAAYGKVDEIIAPPLLSLLISLGGPQGAADENTAAAPEAQAQLDQLADLSAGGLTSVLAVLEGGLPGISQERYRQLKAAAEDEPLIDGVAASILFPTIIRNQSTGQGEPLGFIFAVDEDYDRDFGVTAVSGERVRMDDLRPGVGNIFAQAANVFSAAGDLARRSGLDINLSDAVLAAAGLGALLTGGADAAAIDLNELSISTETLASLGVDTAPLAAQGIEEVSLSSLGITTETLQAIGVSTTTVEVGGVLSNTLGIDTGEVVSATRGLLSGFNLNTLGREIDRALEPFGLELRQGDVYLNRLGAERLDAGVGDVLEVYVGPLPVPFRVKAIVDEAGPAGALLPVVMIRLDEAQKLLFMDGRVNNVLVSNAGDELAGLEHTDAVSERLRVLAMDEDALAEVAAVLRRPDVRPAVDAAAARAQESFFSDDGGEPPPAWLASIIENITPMGAMIAAAQGLPAALDEPGVGSELRTLLAQTGLRSWLLEIEMPAETRSELQAAFGRLNRFDLLQPLSKATVVAAANVGGSVFSTIFTLFGAFSILAAVMLIFLIFVMLAAERRTEMGIARAVGVQRRHLVQMFVTEGMVYDLAAAALGVALGLAVSAGMIGFLGRLVNDVADRFGSGTSILQFHFRATPRSIIVGYCLGVLFTYLVVAFSSWRVSRLNIVAAIRDLPEESSARTRSAAAKLGRWLAGPLLIGAGAVLIYWGRVGNVTYVLVGATLALSGAAYLLGIVLERTPLRETQIERIVYTLIGLGWLAIWAVPWSAFLDRSTLEMLEAEGAWPLLSFVLRGPLVIMGAILTLMFNADVLTWLVTRLLGGIGSLTPALKMAIAYPLSARFRTGMAMVMFAMIIATVTIMALVIDVTQSLIVLDEKESAGFEIATSDTLLSFFNPLRDLAGQIPTLAADYPRLGDIAVVGAVTAELMEVRPEGAPSWARTGVAGVDAGYVQGARTVYRFAARAADYADDAAVWEALATRSDVAIAKPSLFESSPAGDTDGEAFYDLSRLTLSSLAPEGDLLPEIFLELRRGPEEDPFAETAAEDAPSHRVQVIAVLDDATTLAEGRLQLNLRAMDHIHGEPVRPSTFYVRTREGADVRAVAAEIERAFLGSGINASALAESFALGQEVTRGILRLFQGFMALGLLVGIAALGVISSRTVVERRQQIGMLRALGFQSRMVALSLVLEASFIAVTGLLIGAGAGILLGSEIVRTFLTGFTPETQVDVPWGQILLILLLAYGFALLTTIVPALQASRIYPAEALRYE